VRDDGGDPRRHGSSVFAEQPHAIRRRHKEVMEELFNHIDRLPDDQVIATVKTFAANERNATAELIIGLAVMERRRLYVGQGSSSLYSYCVDVLRLSPDAAYNREQTVHAGLNYPAILNDLRTGALGMTAIRVLNPVLTPENHAEVLEAARFKTVREIEQMVAAMTEGEAAKPISRVTRLGPGHYLFQFTGGQTVRDKVRDAQSLLRHSVPDGDLGAIFDRSLDALITNIGRARFATVACRRPGRRLGAGSRTIPAAVRRQVRVRDGDRCAFVGPEGRCTEKGLLQFHHVIPFADGGTATVENIELRCAPHNRYEADEWFGTFLVEDAASFQND
jgi:hypothetical protein